MKKPKTIFGALHIGPYGVPSGLEHAVIVPLSKDWLTVDHTQQNLKELETHFRRLREKHVTSA